MSCVSKLPGQTCLVTAVYSTLVSQLSVLQQQVQKITTEYKALGDSLAQSDILNNSASFSSVVGAANSLLANTLAGQMLEDGIDQLVISLTQGIISDLINSASVGNITADPTKQRSLLYPSAKEKLKQIFGVVQDWWVTLSTVSTLIPNSDLAMFSMSSKMTVAQLQTQNGLISQAISSLQNLYYLIPQNNPQSLKYKLMHILPLFQRGLDSALDHSTRGEQYLETNKNAIYAASQLTAASNALGAAAAAAAPLFDKRQPDFSVFGKFFAALADAQNKVGTALQGQLLTANPDISALLAWQPILSKSIYKNQIPGWIIAATIVMLDYINNQIALLSQSVKNARNASESAQLTVLATAAPMAAVFSALLSTIVDFLLPAVQEQQLSAERKMTLNVLNDINSLYNPYGDVINSVTSLYFLASTGFTDVNILSNQLMKTIGLLSELQQYNNQVIAKLQTIPDFSDQDLTTAINTIAKLSHASKSAFMRNLPMYLQATSIAAVAAMDVVECLTDVIPKLVPSEQVMVQKIEEQVKAKIASEEAAAMAMLPKPISDYLAGSSVVNSLLKQIMNIKDQMKFLECVAQLPPVITL